MSFSFGNENELGNLCLAPPCCHYTIAETVYTQCTSRCADSMRRWFVAGAICYMLNCYQDSTICSLLLLLRQNLLQSADCYCISLLLWYMFLICSETHVTVVLMLSRCRDMCRLSHATDLSIRTSRNRRPTSAFQPCCSCYTFVNGLLAVSCIIAQSTPSGTYSGFALFFNKQIVSLGGGTVQSNTDCTGVVTWRM